MESVTNNRYLHLENYVYNDNTLDHYVMFSIDCETCEFTFHVQKYGERGLNYKGSVVFSTNQLILHYKSVAVWYDESSKQPIDYTYTFNYTMESFKWQKTSTDFFTSQVTHEEVDAYKITFDTPFTVNPTNATPTETCVYYYPPASAPRIPAPVLQIDSELIEQ